MNHKPTDATSMLEAWYKAKEEFPILATALNGKTYNVALEFIKNNYSHLNEDYSDISQIGFFTQYGKYFYDADKKELLPEGSVWYIDPDIEITDITSNEIESREVILNSSDNLIYKFATSYNTEAKIYVNGNNFDVWVSLNNGKDFYNSTFQPSLDEAISSAVEEMSTKIDSNISEVEDDKEDEEEGER